MSDVLAGFSRIAIDKIFHQQSNILSSFSKRRNLNRKNLEPIKQISSEGSANHGCVQVTIRGGDDTNVDLDGLGASYPLEFPFLKDSQERDLSVRGQFAHFVEEDRASLCQFETAQAPLQRSSERALLMAKQFRGNQVARDGCAV